MGIRKTGTPALTRSGSVPVRQRAAAGIPSSWLRSRSPQRPALLKFLIAATTIGTVAASSANADAYIALGDSERGRQIYLDRELGHCLLCHHASQIDAPFQGNLGPDLSDVAARLTLAEIRAKIEDPTVSSPQSAMPAYHRTRGLHQLASAFLGRPILTAEQLTDLMAFLATLDRTDAVEPE
ncbi:MAG: sulfur oxidation c-type cytochrome SoxX [Gammaproteobacteria bacterium]|nr:sulfur oxidation c-type cytochrome SoxX [Gammaproteobacteria bacterium]